jgi:hypothetical protein
MTYRYPIRAEVVLGDIPEINIPEIEVTYSRGNGKPFLGKITQLEDVASFIRTTFDTHTLELQEQFVVLYLNRVNDILGYYRHAKGGIHSVTADTRIIIGVALKSGSVSMIIAHNHPSQVAAPSPADLKLTDRFKKAAAVNDIELLDHLIITKNGFYSFALHGKSDLSGVTSLKSEADKLAQFASKVEGDLQSNVPHNKRSVEKLAAAFGITDKTLVKELTELAIVNRARKLAHNAGTIKERFARIVALYHSQVNLSHRTSQSILLQQYSTPAPIAYLAGVFCGIDKPRATSLYFEPTAGNGLLTIAGDPFHFIVNEIDTVRNNNLKVQGYSKVTKDDATDPFHFKHYIRKFDAVLTNPPFGINEKKYSYGTFPITSLEHMMALLALDCLKWEGKAAIIVGGHTRWDNKGRIQAGKNRIFFNCLYHYFQVADVINIDGHKLYSRQGTAFNVRLILINGRKKVPSGAAPVHDPDNDVVIKTFDDLFSRVMGAMETTTDNTPYAGHARLYKQTFSLREKYPDALLVIREGDNYLAFGKDALMIAKVTDLRISAEFLYKTEVIPLLRIPVISFDIYLSRLTKQGYQVAMADELVNPKEEHMRLLELEAEALALELDLLKPVDGLDAIIPGNIDRHSYERYVTARKKYQSIYRLIVLVKSSGDDGYETFGLDAERLNYMFGVVFTQFSLIGNKKVYGVTIIPETLSSIADRLHQAGYQVLLVNNDGSLGTLDAPYQPVSQACTVLNTQVPDSMAYETHTALQKVKEEVGGDIDNFVRHRLKYPSKTALCKVLSAEQIDAVAMAIYNMEAKSQGMIIGDQTGIGKGRVAAAMIRYGVAQGMKPVFLTEKANLFSDIYRDLSAIGSAHLKPFIVNNREPKTDIKDEEGNVIYQAPAPEQQRAVIDSREVPAKYDFVVATYSQFNSADKKPQKPNFLNAIALDNLFVMDEAHNSSGSGNTGEFLQAVLRNTKGVVFLSATFAKRPDNMPIYALKTAISDCNMTRDDLVEAIGRGGVALQEVLSSQLVGEGQMLRRERSFEGVEVNYITLDDKAQEHRAIADNITEILRDIIAFQGNYVDKAVEELDKIAVAESKEVKLREGTSQAGVDNLPYFSKIFNVINQMLFSLKAEAVVEKTIQRLKEGKKVVIAFASTMGSFIESMENDMGLPVSDGDTIHADFTEVLKRGLGGIMRYTEMDIDGAPIYKRFDIGEFPPDAQTEYHRIMDKILAASTGITISPIDVLIQKLRRAGYSVAEVTGRKFEMQLNWKSSKALVVARKRINTNDAFRQFNNNEVDVLMINQSGSTGASAHAIPTSKVPTEEVKQRVMIVLQAELDISTEVQKRGRINRTGQILKPIYDYVTSAIPAEKRMMMMLQKKLKSLDANTTSNQKQSSKILDVPDFLNKYGDKLVKEYLLENPAVNKLLDDPLYLGDAQGDSGSENAPVIEDAAMKVSGRVAVLSTRMQEEFYTDIAERYNDYVEYLKQVGEYDLEVEDMNLEAETISAKVIKMGKGGDSAFGDDSTLETVKANVLKKPFTATELENLIIESLKGKEPQQQQEEFLTEYNATIESKLAEMLAETNTRYDHLVKDIPNEKKIKKLEGHQTAWLAAIKEREKALNEAREMQLKNTEKTFNNRKHYLEKILKYYYVGRLLNYPVESFNNGSELIPAVFVGFMIDPKKKNPYAPSAVKLRLAIANSSKYLALPASYAKEIMAIIGESSSLAQPPMEQLLSDWEQYTKDNHVDRRIRHIITGNLLQAFSDQKGKLVSYTTMDKQVKKGILLPENWNPGEQVQDNVVVPVLKALPIIKSLVQNKNITTSNGLSIFRHGDYFKLITSASRSRGGDIYLDKDILALVENNNFEKTSDKMVANLPEKNIDQFIEVLQKNHSCSITIQSHQLKELLKGAVRSGNRKQIELPPPAKDEPELEREEPDNIRMLELEAEAIELELHLLAA